MSRYAGRAASTTRRPWSVKRTRTLRPSPGSGTPLDKAAPLEFADALGDRVGCQNSRFAQHPTGEADGLDLDRQLAADEVDDETPDELLDAIAGRGTSP
jgi:hypothetical protein